MIKKMKGFLIVFALCVLGIHAIPKPRVNSMAIRGRVGGGEVATTAPHACMVLVERPDLNGTGTVALGGASIISNRHAVSAAHLTRGQGNTFQVGFLVGTLRRMVRSTFAISHEEYDPATFANDISLIFLIAGNTFPLANAIIIAQDEAEPACSPQCILAGFGFTGPDSTTATTEPMAAIQAVAACTAEELGSEPAESHFCASDTTTSTIVCPGDNGAGLYIDGETADARTLVGVASRILAGCAEPQPTAYTKVGMYHDWLSNLTG